MINYAEAIKTIRDVAKARPPLEIEEISLLDAVGRVAAVDILSPITVPPFDNSAMDGFAIHSALTATASNDSLLQFKVLGTIAAGDKPRQNPAQDGVWEIMTGAPMPTGFDAVVKIEDVLAERDSSGQINKIELRAPVISRANNRAAGEDFEIGTRVIKKGTMIAPDQVMALSSLGLARVQVLRRLRVGVLSTGRELVPMDQKLEEGQIHNSTAPFLLTALRLNGVEATHFGTILDEPEEFARVMKVAIKKKYDVIMTTGAVSMGKFDFVTDGITALGAKTYFHKVAIRPGKPLLFAEFENGPVFFGLPGNPVSGVVGLRFFFDAYLRAVQLQKSERPIRARLKEPVSKVEGLRCFFKAGMGSSTDGSLEVTVLTGQMSFMVSSLLRATAWAILPESSKKLSAGEVIDILPIYYSQYDWQGWHTVTPHTHQAAGGCC